MRILVTGGAGFIGSALCRFLVGKPGIAVLNIDRLTYAADLRALGSISEQANYRFERADICDSSTMEAAFSAFGPTAVLHLAAESHVDRSIASSEHFVRTNILGTHTLLQAARRYWSGLPNAQKQTFRFLHVSTDEVYGSLGPTGSFREATPYDPSSPYSASKAAADHLVRAWHKTYDLPTLVCNCSNNYGPYQFPEKLIPLTILNAIEGRPLPLYGDGSNVRDWLYVDDHVQALWSVLIRASVGAGYNIGGGSELTNLDVVTQICAALDQRRPERRPHTDLIAYVADRPGHDRRYAVDADKIKIELGWRPAESFASGIERTVDWYLCNRDWWLPMPRRMKFLPHRTPAEQTAAAT
jgi:dTDP-glucose 4,6-dehydratase